MGTHSWDVLARLDRSVPERIAAAATASAGRTPVAPSPSASVIVLRDGVSGLETYLLQRHARMAFAASMVVFPGGRVDPADHRAGEQPDDPIRRCAVRETEEETGVRLGLENLHPWAHWITPEVEPRRYDTRFFVAALPEGQQAADISGETDDAQWWTPAAALVAQHAGAIGLMPPTLSILLELAEHPDLASVVAVAAGRTVGCVLPELIQADGQWSFRYPLLGPDEVTS